MERRASRRSTVEDANDAENFQEVRLDDNGNMEEAPITAKLLSGDDRASALRIPTAVMYSFGVVMLLSSCVILVSLFYIMSTGRPFSPRDKPLPKPDPTMTIKLRVADLPESFISALRQQGSLGAAVAAGAAGHNVSAVAVGPAAHASRSHADSHRHVGSVSHQEANRHVVLERPGEPQVLSQLYGGSAGEEASALGASILPGRDVKEIVVIQSPICSQVWESQRVDCHPESVPSFETCRTRGCCFEPVNATVDTLEPGFVLPPACFYPSNYLGYKVDSVHRSPTRTLVKAVRVTPSGLPDDLETIQAEVINYNENTARIRIYDPRNARYEVPLPNVPQQDHYFPVLYETAVSPAGDIEIIRPVSRKVVFHTNLSTLVFADQFLQMSTYIPSRYVYGIGDVKSPILRSTDWQRITLFNAGRSPTEGKNLYSSHPFMLVHEETGESCGIFFLNSNAMDVVLKPSPSVTFRSTGGIVDVFVFLGPSPSAVVQQYTALVGRPAMPPYWALGFHLSRWGYASIDEVKEARRRNVRAGIPVEAVWLDADYMDGLKPFTYDKVRFAGLPEFAQDLHKRDMKVVLTLHPGIDANLERGTYIPFDEGHKTAVFVRSEAGDYNYGMVGNRSKLVFPDFTHPASGDYWTKMLSYFHDMVPFDGLWLDLNEPSSLYNGSERGCPASTLEEPPYLPGEGNEALRTKTLCMTGRQYLSRHYNLHNLYGLTEALRTYDSLRQILMRRPFIISRSTFSGQGRYSGHWSGDIESDWESMRSSISSMLTFNILGIPLTGSDICGFWDNTTTELCNRWQALGAFYPFARNHNAKGNLDQDPAALGGNVAATAKKTLKIRYCFLPYLYTLFHRSHVYGETVARPLFFEFPRDANTYAIDSQFLWGSALLVLPILEPNVTEVKPYVPRGIWYDVMLGLPFHSAGEDFQMTPLNDSLCLLIRGGHVVPSQEPAQTTAASRLKPFNLLVAQNHDGMATGELYWDDGEYIGSYEKGEYSLIKFTAVKNTVSSLCVHCAYDSIMLLNAITVYGVTDKPRDVQFNRQPTNFTYNPAGQFMKVSSLHYQLTKPFVLTWGR
ncbi:lysosomal alpha-glucosidase-like [Haemaphysalis longicornis]